MDHECYNRAVASSSSRLSPVHRRRVTMTAPTKNISLCICGRQDCLIPYGYCHCGCGSTVNISVKNHTKSGHIAGMPYRYCVGHYGREGSIPQGICICNDPNCTIPYGYCHCGCGQKTTIANYTKTALHTKKGHPTRYIRGHTQESFRFLAEGLCICRDPNCKVPWGTCHCGCGKKTVIPSTTESQRNKFRGVPMKYVTGHREYRGKVIEIKERNKRTKVAPPSGSKICRSCAKEKSLSEFSQDLRRKDKRAAYCLSCNKARRYTYYLEHPEKDEQRKENMRDPVYRERTKWERAFKQYGITKQEYESMFSNQNGLCAICGKTYQRNGKEYLLIDHCHTTGKVRGLLCHKCNVGIGLLTHEPELLRKAIHYLTHKHIEEYMF